MAEAIPEGITRVDVVSAVAAFSSGAEHDFAASIAYDLLYEGSRYPPKAILGLAARRLTGQVLKPSDFSGGQSSKCFRVLRDLGFEIVEKPGASQTSYAIITENDESQWHDETGVRYHFPKRYTKILQPGVRVIYYKGRLKNAVFKDDRLSPAPHYFGMATVGQVFQDSASVKGDLYCDIEDYVEFSKALLAKVDDDYLEDIPPSQAANYWRDGVRRISTAVYEQIVEWAAAEGAVVLQPPSVDLPGEEKPSTKFIEGAVKSVVVNAYERNPKARNACVGHHGFVCAVCGFNFVHLYGDIGQDFIHVHHVKDIASIGAEYEVDPIDDLRPVCPNCHAMLHKAKPAMSIEKLKAIIGDRKVTLPVMPPA
ncbi:HNH endonuclease [Anatilimnocola sp. NA78]|uniref:HNH endonuclease n=1 Tax=Anatilimnocola sp. NA78 TaxID=3415683 RepID=UPI003CE4B4F4